MKKTTRDFRTRILSGSEALAPAPRVTITLSAFQRVKGFIDICGYEINGLGIVDRQGNDFTIWDTFLLKQFTDPKGDHVEIDPKALNKFIYQLVIGGGDASKIKFQWHSHAHLPPFFSPEDVDTIGGYMNDFMISLVINKKGDYRCRLDLFKPFKLSLEVPLLVKVPSLSRDVIGQCKKEMGENVTVRSSLFGFSIEREAIVDVNAIQEITVRAEDIVEEVEAD